MSFIHQDPQFTDLVHQEATELQFYSRDSAPIAVDTVVQFGQVLGKITASGEYVPVDPAATDGSDVAKVVAIVPVDTTDQTDAIDIPVMARQCYLINQGLVFGDLTEAQITTATAELKQAGMLTVNASGPTSDVDLFALGFEPIGKIV